MVVTKGSYANKGVDVDWEGSNVNKGSYDNF